MIANVVSGRVKPDADDRMVRDHLIPAFQQQAGYLGGHWLRQPNSDEVLAVTLWESEDVLRAALTNPNVKEATAKTSSAFIGGPNLTVYQVIAQG